MTLSATVSAPSRLYAWKTNPIRSRRSSVNSVSDRPDKSVSPSTTRPDVGRSRPAAQFRNVLLPDPDGPMTAVNVPRGNPAVTPSRARTSFLSDPYTFDTESNRTAHGGVVNVGSAPGRSDWVAVASTSAPRRLDGFLLLNFMRPTLNSATVGYRYPVPPDARYRWL